MLKRYVIWGGLTLAVLSLAGLGAKLYSLPPAPVDAQAPPIAKSETDALLASMKPPKRTRPLVAVVGLNDATETTDYLMSAGILRRAGVADVVTLATGKGPVKLYPALTVEPDATIAQFDSRHPDGADYVIVPAMSRDDDPAVLAWLRKQARNGAIVVSVCAGAKVTAAAGLLDGRRATTHWYYVKELLDKHPSIAYVPDRRMVADRGVVTTTGITASMPTMLTLIEAIAGRRKAEAVAQDLGVTAWDARHASNAFKMTRPFAATVLANSLAFWNREQVAMELKPGMDEVSLALAADAWSRTYRSKVVTFAAASSPIESLGGFRLVPDRSEAKGPAAEHTYTFSGQKPADTLDKALLAISARYGPGTRNVVAMQLEYP